jgi:ActR/RegA family two-component response regulator
MHDCRTTVLLVEDDLLVARTHGRALTAAGFAVEHLTSPAEVAARVPEASWHAAIVDLRLGEESGLDVARMLRAARPSLPVAFYSSETDPVVLAAARAVAPVVSKWEPVEVVLTALGLAAPAQG